MLRPLRLLLLAEIAFERLLTPWTLGRVGNRRVSRHRLIFPRILQKLTPFASAPPPFHTRICSTHQTQRSMPTHTMSENAYPLPIHLLEIVKNGLRQLRRDVGVHLISLRPRQFGSIDVEASAGAKVIVVIFALDFEATWFQG